MAEILTRPASLIDVPNSYCPGCGHGVVHRVLAEVLDELQIEGKTVGVAPVGCAVRAYDFFNCDMIQAPHGRAPLLRQGQSAPIRTTLCLPIRATATLPQLVRRKWSMPQPVVKISQSFL